jgi:DNA helicase IV
MNALRAPVFAQFTVEIEGRRRALHLGEATSMEKGRTILDWRTAPLAEVFFAHRAGESFEIEVGEDVRAGKLLDRCLLDPRGEQLAIEAPIAPLPRTRRPRSRVPRLDRTQRRIAELPAERSLLVLGEAGFGKTTVALHRLAHLERQAKDGGRPFKGLVLVPAPGLARLSRLLLDRHGVERADVFTYEAWARKEARRIFSDLPKRDSIDTGASVIRLKRHPALRPVIADLACRIPGPTRRRDLLHLFGDRALLERAAAASNGAISRHAIDEVLEHTHVQFSITTEEEFAHVEKERLETTDGRRIDAGTPLEDARSIDSEDAAVLFELDRIRGRSRSRRIERYDLVVVDEAQELAPIELSAIARAKKERGSIVVAGDEHQQIDDTACFSSWKDAMAELGAIDHETAVLEESHRCPPAVLRFARALIGNASEARPSRTEGPGRAGARAAGSGRSPRRPERGLDPSVSGRASEARPTDGGALVISRFSNACHLEAHLIEAVRQLEAADPKRTIAIVAKTVEAARSMEKRLSRGLATRLAIDGAFDFRPGVVVTAVPEVKGLEFDVAIVPDADAVAYPATGEARRALYVAVTRAIDRAWIMSSGSVSPLLESEACPRRATAGR